MKPMNDLLSRSVGVSSVIKLRIIILKGKEDENKSSLEKLTHKETIRQCRYSVFAIRDFLFVSEKLSLYGLSFRLHAQKLVNVVEIV
jgi:hypothetical protein